MPRNIFTTVLALLIFCSASFSQDDEAPTPVSKTKRGFHAGLFVGTLFANKYTASLYDGYGFDLGGHKNNFDNSAMQRKIVVEYGGNHGAQPDRIAQSLNVNSTDWQFTESDMPINLKYNVAFLLGLNTRYCINNKNAIILNVNAAKLSVTGSFTITLLTSSINATTPGYQNFKTFTIIGAEQRLLFQLGYQYIFGDSEDPFNFFVEGGLACSLAKYDKNQIIINSLQIDLRVYYDQLGYQTFRAKNMTGVGFGAFGGFGLNLSASQKWTIQLLYAPSLENINIGEYSKETLQHAVGLRAYYNL